MLLVTVLAWSVDGMGEVISEELTTMFTVVGGGVGC